MEKTLNNTQKLSGVDQLNLTTLNANPTRLSNNSSALAIQQPLSLGNMNEKFAVGTKASTNS